MNNQISANLTLIEATNSNTARKLGISNQPNAVQYAHITLLADNVIEPIYANFGKSNVGFSSLFRSAELNKKVKGSTTSDHTGNIGAAVDLHTNNPAKFSNADLFKWAKAYLDFDQMIWEFGNSTSPDWVHIGYRPTGNRKMLLRATKVNGKTVYTPFA